MPAQFSKPDVLGFAMRLKEQREAQALARRKSQVDAINAIASMKLDAAKEQREVEKHQLEMQKIRQDLHGTAGPLLSGANDTSLGPELQQKYANRAISTLNSQINSTRDAQGNIPAGAPEMIGRAAGGVALQDEVDRARKLADDRVKAKKENDIVGNAILTAEGKMAGGRAMIARRKKLGEKIKSGDESEVTREEFDLVDRLIKNQGRPIQVQNGISPNLIDKHVNAINGSKLTLDTVDRLEKEFSAGEIDFGAPGFVKSMVSRYTGIVDDILSMDNLSPDMRSLLEGAKASPDGTVKLKTASGKQLTLNLDQLILGYGFVKSQRDSSRFTILEFAKVMNEIELTSPWTNRGQVFGAMKKIATMAAQKSADSRAFLGYFGVDPAAFEGDASRISPRDMGILDRLGARSEGDMRRDGVVNAPQSTPQPAGPDGQFTADQFMKLTPDQILDMP